MEAVKTLIRRSRHGAALILSMIFLVIFSALAVSMATMSGSNVQLANNHHKVNTALCAAQSGIECGKYLARSVVLESTNTNYVTTTQANTAWLNLCQHMQDISLDNQTVPSPTRFTDGNGSGDQIVSQQINYGNPNSDFSVRFYRYDSDPHIIKLEATGTDGDVTRTITVDMKITKDSEVLNYAIASRGRMWITGDSTIYGDIYSSWDRADISPFNMTSDSQVLGTINTILDLDEILNNNYQLETLDENGNPIDQQGNPLGTNYEDRYYGPDDEIQGYHEGINYDQMEMEMPGMDISDYDTDDYKDIVINQGSGDIPTSETIEVEYFPHASGNYNYPRDGSPSNTWNLQLNRHVYENQTFTNARLPDNRNALFKNCTFEGILYIDCYKNTSSYYNNVRFDNCQFNGVIVTDVPQQFKWQHNCLYFTGEADFNNTSDIQEATVLAPHFNVNLGNTNPQQSDNNVITGAIVGGIVDVRGNAQIYGTIISMCDTTQWSSGYVTNIGATLDDGGSETTDPGDVGYIEITPDEEQMLPSGITTPIIIKPIFSTYTEG